MAENPYSVKSGYPMARDIACEDAWAEGHAAAVAEIVEWLRSDPVEIVRVELADLIESRYPEGKA